MSEYLERDLDSSTAFLVLGHLSEQNNHPEIVRLVASQALEGRGHSARVFHRFAAQPVGRFSILIQP